MNLPDDTNETIAEMEGWIEPSPTEFWVHTPSGKRKLGPPDYRNSIDAIEPVFRRLCPGALISYACDVVTIMPKDGPSVHADTLVEAMCAAVLATRIDITPYNDESERTGKYKREYIARPNEQEADHER